MKLQRVATCTEYPNVEFHDYRMLSNGMVRLFLTNQTAFDKSCYYSKHYPYRCLDVKSKLVQFKTKLIATNDIERKLIGKYNETKGLLKKVFDRNRLAD